MILRPCRVLSCLVECVRAPIEDAVSRIITQCIESPIIGHYPSSVVGVVAVVDGLAKGYTL